MKKVMRRYFLKVDVEYLVQLRDLHNDLPFLLEIMRIKVIRVKKLPADLHGKIIYKKLKGSNLKKSQRVIKFTWSDWLQPCIEINTDLWRKLKNDFEKDFLKSINNQKFVYWGPWILKLSKILMYQFFYD